MAFCVRCGAQMPDGIVFCTNCGAAIEKKAPSDMERDQEKKTDALIPSVMNMTSEEDKKETETETNGWHQSRNGFGNKSVNAGQPGGFGGQNGNAGQSGNFGGQNGNAGQPGGFGGQGGNAGQPGGFGGQGGNAGQPGNFGGQGGNVGQPGGFGGQNGNAGQFGNFGGQNGNAGQFGNFGGQNSNMGPGAPYGQASGPQPNIPRPVTVSPAPGAGSVFETVGTGGFIGWILLFSIPVIGLISAIIVACASRRINLRNFAKAVIFWKLLALTLLIIIVILAATVFEYELRWIIDEFDLLSDIIDLF